MKKPIFYKHEEDCEIFVFADEKIAERYIEPIEINRGGGVFYDSEGKILGSKVEVDPRGIEQTVIYDDGREVFRKSELREHLIDYLEIVHHKRPEIIEFGRAKLEEMSLFELASISLKIKTD